MLVMFQQRENCGFVAHSATLGCSKCLKPFPSVQVSGVKRIDYSGFDRETWQPRSPQVHYDKVIGIYVLIHSIEGKQ